MRPLRFCMKSSLQTVSVRHPECGQLLAGSEFNVPCRIWCWILILFLVSGCAGLRQPGPEVPPPGSEEKAETKKHPPKKEIRRMLVTAYDPGQKSTCWRYHHGLMVYSNGPQAGKLKKVGVTADGTRAKKGTIAADLSRYPYGTRMYIPGYGWGEVHDIGSAIQGDHIDVFYETEKEALRWGKRSLNITVVLPDPNDPDYKRKRALHIALREDLRKKLAELARKKNIRQRDLVAEAVEDLLKKYEAEDR